MVKITSNISILSYEIYGNSCNFVISFLIIFILKTKRIYKKFLVKCVATSQDSIFSLNFFFF